MTFLMTWPSHRSCLCMTVYSTEQLFALRRISTWGTLCHQRKPKDQGQGQQHCQLQQYHAKHLGLRTTTETAASYLMPQLLPLIQTRRLRFFGHVARMSDSQDTFRSFTYVDPRAAQGLETPPRTSTSNLASDPNADLHPLNHGLNSAWRLAQDRERWRQLVETATLQPGARS